MRAQSETGSGKRLLEVLVVQTHEPVDGGGDLADVVRRKVDL
jgi:hypothetical protein